MAHVTDGLSLFHDYRLGHANDLSGNGNNGTLYNFAYAPGDDWTADGIQMEGTDSYIRVLSSASLNLQGHETVEFVVRREWTDSRIVCFYGKRGPGTGDIIYDVNNNLRIGSPTAWNTSYIFPANEFVHFVFTRNSTTRAGVVYINGVSTYTTTFPGNDHPNGIDLYIGRDSAISQYFARATYKLLRVYNRPLSQSEVTQNYEDTLGTTPAGITMPVKVNGAWKAYADGWTKVSGTWRNISAVYTKVSGEWK